MKITRRKFVQSLGAGLLSLTPITDSRGKFNVSTGKSVVIPIHPVNSREDERAKQSLSEGTSRESSFLELYQSFVSGNTEAPTLFHVWSAVCGVAATLGKGYYFTRGHFRIYPNLYVMLIGSPGTGKGTCINILQSILLESGYRTFAADKSSKEKFLIDFEQGFLFSEEEEGLRDAMGSFSVDEYLAEGLDSTNPKEVFILAEEFNDFIGNNNSEFISLLTKLWSYEGVYRSRLKNSRSVSINEPCINILGGNTSAGFALAFPPEIIGQGFLARLLPIYGEPTGRKITFPTKPSGELRSELARSLSEIRRNCTGEAAISEEGRDLLERIHQGWQPMLDSRFQHYAARRFNQLIKLCLVFSSFDKSSTLLPHHIRRANTLLTHTEDLMPKAIGEFGKARNADVTSKIMELLWQAKLPLTTQQLWKAVSNDLSQMTDLATILANLQHAEKIQKTAFIDKEKKTVTGWLPKTKVEAAAADFIDSEFKKLLL